MSNLYLLLVFVMCICYFIHTSGENTGFVSYSSGDHFYDDEIRLVNPINRHQRVKRSRGYPRFSNTGLYPYSRYYGSQVGFPTTGLNGFTGFPTTGLNGFTGFPTSGLTGLTGFPTTGLTGFPTTGLTGSSGLPLSSLTNLLGIPSTGTTGLLPIF
ncbi:uncharacterized protein LOC143233312 isoform X2 [Tachypleus tridentatus]|uniref:uncharacterized protein LOC143233312 isoform X2 n=1 Tax=Tachypleus tridentatus TaxID=6853 RepID=UPI003FD4B26D